MNNDKLKALIENNNDLIISYKSKIIMLEKQNDTYLKKMNKSNPLFQLRRSSIALETDKAIVNIYLDGIEYFSVGDILNKIDIFKLGITNNAKARHGITSRLYRLRVCGKIEIMHKGNRRIPNIYKVSTAAVR